LEHIYYGHILDEDAPIKPHILKQTALIGSSVLYDDSDSLYCLDNMCLEWSGFGKGDYRSVASEIKMPDGTFNNDFIYSSYNITKGNIPMKSLPSSYADESECETLEITLNEISNNVSLKLYYTVYYETNIIARRAVLTNNSDTMILIRKLMSLSLDMPNRGYCLTTFDGGWIKEAHKHENELRYGIHINSSTVGASSNRHNPGFLLSEKYSNEDNGNVYGFNLIYSGNHYSAIELSNHDIVRVETGINPMCFEWELNPGESFETPEALMTFSSDGYNGLSANFHDFINRHIVRGDWKGKERPVLYNNWEACFFRFTRGKLLKLARIAKNLGVELFVLDDGWFKNRDNDMAGLGDYEVNKKKLPRGVAEISKKIHGMGMKFGLWVEPEMVNEDSDLFRAHPEYAICTPGKKPAKGRNQLVLDLCNEDVRKYIIENVCKLIDEAGVDYIKWDWNRHISDAYSNSLRRQGEFYHRYILGLYEILDAIFIKRPHILFESCASGGNRFDLGMLMFSPQIWSSDDTDPIERLSIQGGLSYLYPLSVLGAHVSDAPHQQTLRDTPLPTRFNVAAFGSLGYELDLRFLSKVQRKEIKNQIALYKKYRKTLQFGRFKRANRGKDNKVVWHCISEDKKEAVTGFFQTLTKASEGFDILRIPDLEQKKEYITKTRAQSLFIKRFGGLVKHILPVNLDPDGLILRLANRYYAMTDCVEEYTAKGAALADGIMLNNQFIGSYYNENIRLLGDFGSNLYITEEVGCP
jgi:alpha-galactosidase